jgi:pullulanase
MSAARRRKFYYSKDDVNLTRKILKASAYSKPMCSKSFNDKYYYSGSDLGNTYSKDNTAFRVWAPLASEIKLLTYTMAEDTTPSKEIDMVKSEKGTWTTQVLGNQDGLIYTYKVKNHGIWAEAVDPYVRAVTLNGEKGVVVDLSSTNQKGWNPNKKPIQNSVLDTIIYELHVRDLSSFKESGIKNAGKFLGLTEKNTKGPMDTSTGLSYITELGITHVQLLPIYDYATVDEADPKAGFNWGYDPQNYNAVEGSYSTNAADPKTRITEFKQAIQAMHDEGLGVIMDVVYNHMFTADESNFNKIVPDYYFRKDENVGWVDESYCGNTIASENAMVRKFIVDSTTYWAKEYNLDGFRFDLMGLMDVTTMKEIRTALDAIDKNIFIHGEGWNMGTTLAADEKAKQGNAGVLKGIGFFNDTIRDGIKGSVFEGAAAGWVNGNYKCKSDVLKGIVGAIYYDAAINTWGPGIEPYQATNYVEAHDNHTLWDKLQLTNPNSSEEVRRKMDFLAASIIFTSQGIPFIQAGQEFLRSKGGDENSFKSPDEVNMLNWAHKAENTDVINYYKGLIELRKAHPAFKMPTAAMIKEKLKFTKKTPESVIAYTINDNANGDIWSDIFVGFNADTKPRTVTLPKAAKWNIVVDGKTAGVKILKQISGNTYEIPALSTVVMYTGHKK